MMPCPFCAEQIQEAATICRWCKQPLRAPEPQKPDVGLAMVLPVGRSPLAIIAGYLGLFSLCVIPAPIALIVSLLAIRDLQKNRHLLGWGRAIFGLVLGVLGTIALLIGIVVHLSEGRRV